MKHDLKFYDVYQNYVRDLKNLEEKHKQEKLKLYENMQSKLIDKYSKKYNRGATIFIPECVANDSFPDYKIVNKYVIYVKVFIDKTDAHDATWPFDPYEEVRFYMYKDDKLYELLDKDELYDLVYYNSYLRCDDYYTIQDTSYETGDWDDPEVYLASCTMLQIIKKEST